MLSRPQDQATRDRGIWQSMVMREERIKLFYFSRCIEDGNGRSDITRGEPEETMSISRGISKQAQSKARRGGSIFSGIGGAGVEQE
jgi:hypothetical protein